MSVGWPEASASPREREQLIYRDLRPANRPAWTDLTSAGPWSLEPGESFDRHFHDCDEYWLIAAGAALVEVEPESVLVVPGDILCIERGRAHDVVELYAPLRAFWVEGPVEPGGRVGSLHRMPDDARGHPVPLATAARRPAACAGEAVWRELAADTRPPWCELVGAGLRTLTPGAAPPASGDGVDEYWLIVEGSARLRLDQDVYEVGPGDLVCIEAGRSRELVELSEPMRYFWLERDAAARARA